MEDETTTVLTISDLIQSARPLTAASSLLPSRPTDLRRSCNQNLRRRKPIYENSKLQTLKPLNHSALLIGTLTLPSSGNRSSPLDCNCFQFSDDGSTTICCEILDFDPKMIGPMIRVLAWNFIPFECGSRGVKSGFLEIITWDFSQACNESLCSMSDFSCFCLSLGACDIKNSSTALSLIFGVIESISPVSVDPWASGGGGDDSSSVSGFLVHILVCKCKYCASKCLVSEARGLCERDTKDHCFSKSRIVYFCGLTSSWHPMISRFIGDVVLLSGLKKKLVFLRKEESQLMYLTTEITSLHTTSLFKEQCPAQNSDIRGKGECGCYTGVITGIYMQRMLLELDQDVILIVTDNYLALPHYVRAGVLVTLRNVHFVDPKFRWGKMLILGACARTSMHVKSFSPMESWCHLKQYSPSLLQKFINSLPFAARLWALLVVSCFRRIFAGILSEKDILGSKHKEGLAQKYASSHLPLSAFQIRHGILLEFCKHDLCSGSNEVDCGRLKMVLPIANLVSYCEATWKKVLNSKVNCPDFMGGVNHQNPICCGGRSFEQSIRRVFSSEEIGVVVMGNLKISSSSGRLQLVDATGCVDFVLNLPETWDFNRIFEASDFRLIMECACSELVDLNSTIHQPLSCRSIFSNALPLKNLKTLTYLYNCTSDEDSRSHSLFYNSKKISHFFNSGKYHLLWLTHKFPIQQKCLGDLAKRPNTFAKAIVLPWDLLVTGKYRNASEEANCHWMGMLHCSSEFADFVSSCKPPRRNILLEFSPDCLLKYELLKIGCCYLAKHEEGDTLCCKEANYQVSRAKLFVTVGTQFSSLKLSSIEGLQRGDPSDSSNERIKGSSKFEIPCLIGNSSGDESYSDVNIYVPSSALNLTENYMKVLSDIPNKPSDSFEEESSIHECSRLMINASMQSSGTSYSDHPLPQGNLITVHGLVLAFHDCNGVDFLAQPGHCRGEGSDLMFFQKNTSFCVHVFVNNHIVKIFCDRSKEAFPIGLGIDAYATFHRVLILSELDNYMLTAVSFITIDHARSMRGHFGHELSDASRAVGSHSVPSQDTAFIALISDALQLSELRPMQFRCKIVSLYILVLEKYGSNLIFRPCVQSVRSASTIPFAGFIIDDGSSSCCCWADSERAAAFLGLDTEEYSIEDALGRSKADEKQLHIAGRVNRILEKHGRILVKNCGFMFDSSCQDLEVTGNSNRSIRSSDEDFLQIFITKALLSSSWTVECSLMDSKTTTWLEQRLAELDFALPPLLNVWATSIHQTETLAEARSMIQELL